MHDGMIPELNVCQWWSFLDLWTGVQRSNHVKGCMRLLEADYRPLFVMYLPPGVMIPNPCSPPSSRPHCEYLCRSPDGKKQWVDLLIMGTQRRGAAERGGEAARGRRRKAEAAGHGRR
jgi:hypothetical protein